MARPPSDPELKNEFSAQIKSLLSRLTAQEIATELGVQRQTVYNYRDGKNVPSPEVIRRAMEAWPDFSLSYRGRTLTLQDFRRKPIVTAKKAVQYELWDVIKKLNSESIEIEILKKESSSVQLGVRIFFRNREK
jgi:transcriptional regulator with XRE-family HTH domain